MSRCNTNLLSLIIIIILASGCSSGGGNPITPGPQDTREPANELYQQLLLGLYDIEIDGDAGTIQVVPLRGPAFQVNVVQYLQPPMGNPANLGVSINPDGTDIMQGLFDIDISITHPFAGTNLRGFDVRGILLGNKGTQLSNYDYNVQYPKPTETRLLNADGYTRWWNAVEFLTPGLFGYTPTIMGSGNPKATVNGYKYFTDGLGASDPLNIDTVTRGTFSTQDGTGDPNTLTRQFIIQFPVSGGPIIKFRYAIGASFGGPDPGTPPPAPVDSYSLEANCPEPYQISVSLDPTNTAYYTSTGSGGDLIFNMEIYDWQALENPGGVPDEINHVLLESPSLWDGYLSLFDVSTPLVSTNPTMSAWQVEIENVLPMDYFQDVFITVQSADPTSYMPPVPGSGIYPGGATLSAYHLFTIEMPGNSPPDIGPITGPNKYVPGAELGFNLESASDLQDGPNVTIFWDFDNDGVFEDDLDGSDTNLSGSYIFTGDETYYVQCRVYDTANAYTDSNVLTVEPLSLPYIDPMDNTTESLWTISNGLFDTHSASLQWNVQGEFWSTGDVGGFSYQNYMDTTLISPLLPAGLEDTVYVTFTHRYDTEGWDYDTGEVLYRKNSGSWIGLSPVYNGTSLGYPAFVDVTYSISSMSPGDFFEIAFHWNTDGSVSGYNGWDITHLMVMDNQPPEITGIFGPASVDSLGPWTYTTVATDLDGIDTYMWSVEPDGLPPVYDDPGDGAGSIEVTFPTDGTFDIWVEATDLGDPPLSTEFGPYLVTVFFTNPDAWFSDHFETDTGAWTYTGGTGDGAYQDFWHIETGNSIISNVGPDGCYAETSSLPIEKTASIDVVFPSDPGTEARFRMLHMLDVESGGGAIPFDGQWVTLDGSLIEPTYGFLYDDDEGGWAHGYFVDETNGWETSTFLLGTTYNDGMAHTLTFHQFSSDQSSNCLPGWQIDYVEFWLVD